MRRRPRCAAPPLKRRNSWSRGRSILQSGERLDGRNPNAFIEYYRADESGQIAEAPTHLSSRYGGYNGSSGDNPLSALFNFFDRGFDRGGPFGNAPLGRPARQHPSAGAGAERGPSYRGPRIEFLDRLFR